MVSGPYHKYLLCFPGIASKACPRETVENRVILKHLLIGN